MVGNDRISIVVQGPVSRSLLPNNRLETEFCLERCRAVFPRAQLIFSTWKGSAVEGLRADEFVFSEDPGPQGLFHPVAVANNVNRQIVSTVAGLLRCSEETTLKIRSDVILNSKNFVDIFDKCPSPKGNYGFFDRVLVSNNLSTKNPNTMKGLELYLHPADHAHFGLTRDLLKLWNVPLQTDQEAEYFCNMDRPNGYRMEESSRLTPEQFVCVSAFCKKFDIKLSHYADNSSAEIAQKMLLQNFVFVPDHHYSIYLQKYHNFHHANYKWMRYDTYQAKGFRAVTARALLLSRMLGRLWKMSLS